MQSKTLLYYILLAMVYGSTLTTWEAQGSEDYKVDVTVNEPEDKTRGKQKKITFTFMHKNRTLTVEEFIGLYRTYDAKVANMFIQLNRKIADKAEEYDLWDGFSLTAMIADVYGKSSPYTMVMEGTCQPDKVNPTQRTDKFLQYKGDPKDRYQEIRGKEPRNVLFREAFDEHLATAKAQHEDFQSVVFTSPSGSTLIVIPRKGFTTVYDFGKDGTDAEIGNYWYTVLAVLQKYHTNIRRLCCNTGHTCAAQTVPHVHMRCELKSAMSAKRQLIAYSESNKVVFQALPKLDPESPPFWKDPPFVVFCLLLGATIVYMIQSQRRCKQNF